MKTIALLFGGRSMEHEISVRSARNVFAAINREKYQLILVGISRVGKWYEMPADTFGQDEIDIEKMGEALALIPGFDRPLLRLSDQHVLPKIDAVFPVLHGPFCEDGSLQGILMHLDLPFVGPDHLGSAVAMDKDVAKRILREGGLSVANGLVYHLHEKNAVDYLSVANQLGMPVFVKPANMGSSVGVSKASNPAEFKAAVELAFQYDKKIVIEEMLNGRELECAVLGNQTVEMTDVGEISTEAGEHYDFEAKYVSETAAQLIIPAKVSHEALGKLRLVAKQAFKLLCCEGMARVDMFLTEENEVYVNEVNTLPGFTKISMYPKLWEAVGIDYSQLIDHLIEFAIERFEREQQLKR